MANLRIGDLERDAAAESLSAHYAAGRLDRGEFDERLAVAYTAKTGAELTPLFADLPSAAVATATPAPDRQVRGAYFPVLPLLALFVVVSSIAAISNGFPPVLLFVALIMLRAGRHRRRHGWR